MVSTKRQMSKAKKNLRDIEEVRAWEVAFACGRDYFNNLRDLGFDFHEREVDHDVAREAWSRLRTAFYELRATRPDPIGGECRGRNESLATLTIRFDASALSSRLESVRF
jgi:hypothetical protein